MLLVTGCSERSSAEAEPSAQLPAPSSSARPMVDLRKKVNGKVLLHHVADSNEVAWSGELKVGNAYKIAVDCAGSRGKLAITISASFRTLRQCAAGYTTFTLDNYPVGKPERRTLTVKAPSGARWAVLVAGLS
ncbi:hypothetical protein [Nonomuraea maritima]|nr:hypothetical protein [Nonomuraea maritima]